MTAFDAENLALLKAGVPSWRAEQMDAAFRVFEALDFQACFEPEGRGERLEAARCFQRFVEAHPESGRVGEALWNSGVNWFEAGRVEEALQARQRLVNEHPGHELAAQALFGIAEVFRETTVFDQAAEIYEQFAAIHPRHELAQQALRHASVFRKVLGDHDEAVEAIETYLKRYG